MVATVGTNVYRGGSFVRIDPHTSRVVGVEFLQPANEGERGARARPELSEEAFALLHAALANPVAGQYGAWSAALKHAVTRICIDARRNDWPAERLLIALKGALYALPVVQDLTREGERDEFVARLVSLCIDEYYAVQR